MSPIAKTVVIGVAARAIVVTAFLVVGYAARKYEMKQLAKEYKELCEKTEIES